MGIDFDLLNLFYFKTVAEYENITRAAEYLHISQPALSKAISKIESQLGVSLFIREKKRIKLSKSGKAFYPYVSRAFDEISNGVVELESMKRNKTSGGIVRIASSLGEMFMILHEMFVRESEGNEVLIEESICAQDSIVSKLQNNSIDFAICGNRIEQTGFECFELAEEELLLLVSDDNPLSKRGEICMCDLQGEKLMIAQHHYESELIVNYCRNAGFSANIQLYTSDGAVIDQCLKDNHAVTFFPKHEHLRRSRHLDLGYRPVKIKDANITRHIYIVKKSDRKLSRFADTLYNAVISYFRDEFGASNEEVV